MTLELKLYKKRLPSSVIICSLDMNAVECLLFGGRLDLRVDWWFNSTHECYGPISYKINLLLVCIHRYDLPDAVKAPGSIKGRFDEFEG